MLTKEDDASFTYCWGMYFFLETKKGNFVWKDPDYGGDNTISPYKGNLKDFYKEVGTSCGRDKGRHKIKDYCKDAVIVSE